MSEEKRKNLLPLTYMRSFGDLICGARPIKEKKRLIKEIKYPWDLVSSLKEELEADFKIIKPKKNGTIHKSAVLIKPKKIHIAKGAQIGACAVLDATFGPIFIGEGTIVHPQSFLRGPLYVGKHCRIAGELVHSVILDYTNKGHYGFIGHSYIGEWVNLGAGTTNSNLKNNYSSVKVVINGEGIDTGETFVGCFIGDHAKTAIGTLIYTGAVVGVFANIFGALPVTKFVPSFSWGGKGGRVDLQKAKETAKAMMARRGVPFSADYAKLMEKIYEETSGEKEKS
ncbi:hypothetical protein A2276_00815 [candidate division WOR-1 bacterium RIFOXYA12_FULL_43_27]|uniref:Glucose-1-phosphate thymidylyltransferase n=1 Tax=candidate division WOR-1 bacterium RIFOXYC2_FULL_46_14 TaxID=1802587 RepID=A0A1F4U4K4_UNCSA|nr:MAG: hypothetical protein A2276_00815 [candidate division WOR-1 bacterium RIFOXYA12_FULL_43_27]OGC20772.1 MAG: hypothetical protein A2292_07060 [candidate division WOR-1 bacterium RIFOXYB2_FULL_46_45]OGC31491.1 MAG: hypothetical protein A2232_04390 [candidate division WOR-1 bacterium RIFOXYA2_FULL_46_56]OGC39898.1 MAG: hypothetical protein A2438_05230 [candidate division WOR-1 bacterium RIFOXYC2_FULL_46_14]